MRLLFALAVGFSFFIQPLCAHASDWKFYAGYYESSSDMLGLFYDNASLSRKGGITTVWNKTVRDKELIKALNEHDEELIAKIKNIFDKGYMPPYAKKHNMSDVQIDNIVKFEVAANSSYAKTLNKVLYEINCKTRKVRIISSVAYDDNEVVKNIDRRVSDWVFVSPDSNSDALVQVICK